MSTQTGAALERLVQIMARLRGEGGCPWDREQDLRSLRPYLLEEAHEVLDEMDRVSYGGKWGPLCEELGDLLFQIVFHAQLASELGEFRMADVCDAISNKIESRHPHVFGTTQADSAHQVLANWAKLKAEERKKKTGSEGSVLDGVPTAAPALLRAERLTEKASRIGFDWPDLAGVRQKLDEELRELDEAIARGSRDEREHELGDVLFSLANLARFIQTPPEDALRSANGRFTARFQQVEAGLRAKEVPFGAASLEQMDALWNEAKRQERALPPPRGLPRAEATLLRVPCEDPPAAFAFWKKVGPLIGWSTDKEGLTVRPEAGGLGLSFSQGTAALGLGLTLDAPSRAAVDALKEQLTRVLGSCDSPTLGADGRYGLQFMDPAGIRCRYATTF